MFHVGVEWYWYEYIADKISAWTGCKKLPWTWKRLREPSQPIGNPPKLMPHNPYSKAAKPIGDPPIFGDGIFAWKNNFAGSSCDKTRSQVVQWCQANGVVVVPGVATPTEVAVGWSTRTGAEFASSESFQMFVYIISSHLKSHFDFCQFDLRSLFYLIHQRIDTSKWSIDPQTSLIAPEKE